MTRKPYKGDIVSLSNKLADNGLVSSVFGFIKTSYKVVNRVGKAYSIDEQTLDVKVEDISEDWFSTESHNVSQLYIQLELAKLENKPNKVKRIKRKLTKAKYQCGVVNTRIENKAKAIKKAKKDMKQFEKLMSKSIKNS